MKQLVVDLRERKIYAGFGSPPAFTLLSCSPYLTQNMVPINSSETSVDFQRITRRYIPKDDTNRVLVCEGFLLWHKMHHAYIAA
jgi:hypothetical protein